MKILRAYFLNYLLSKGIEITTDDGRDRFIEFRNPKYDTTAYIFVSLSDEYIEDITVARVCARLIVEVPPADQFES